MAEERVIALEARGLSGGYGRVPILHGIDLDVGEGEVVGILGHNGMGKSTLLKTLMGFLPAHAGTVRQYGTDITHLPPNERARLGIGYVPQGRGIFPRLSVRENLHFARRDHGDSDEGAALAALLIDFPRLEPLLDRTGEMLSGGEQQLLALARCLMGDPVLLLLDEPTEGIQPSIIEDMAQILARLRESRGLSILLVEQNLDFIAALADRVLVLERGRITGELARGELSDRAKLDRHLGFGAAHSRRADRAADPQTPERPPLRRRTRRLVSRCCRKPALPHRRRSGVEAPALHRQGRTHPIRLSRLRHRFGVPEFRRNGPHRSILGRHRGRWPRSPVAGHGSRLEVPMIRRHGLFQPIVRNRCPARCLRPDRHRPHAR